MNKQPFGIQHRVTGELAWREEAAPCLFGERSGVRAGGKQGWLAGWRGRVLSRRIPVALSYASVPLGFLHTGEAPAKPIQGLCVALAVQVMSAGYLWLWRGVGEGDPGCVPCVPWECQRVLLAVGPALMEALWWLCSHTALSQVRDCRMTQAAGPSCQLVRSCWFLCSFFMGCVCKEMHRRALMCVDCGAAKDGGMVWQRDSEGAAQPWVRLSEDPSSAYFYQERL